MSRLPAHEDLDFSADARWTRLGTRATFNFGMPLVSEEERVAALGTYAVLDTGAEPAFDELTQLAASICQVPIALLSFVEGDRQWFKSCAGIALTETPRAASFCAHAIEHDGPLMVRDATADARFAKNPLVTGPPGIRFYAGFPLIDEGGAALGTLCVIDIVPRALTALQKTALAVLAKQVLVQLRLRRTTHMLGAELDWREQGARARDHRQTSELLQARALREQVDLAHQRASFLADAGKLLAASLETERTLEAVAVLAVPRFADLCSIVVCAEGGTLRRVADAGLELEGAREMQRLREDPRGSETGSLVAIQAAIDRGEPLLFTDYQEWLAARLPADDGYLATVRRMEVTSAMSAPMLAGDGWWACSAWPCRSDLYAATAKPTSRPSPNWRNGRRWHWRMLGFLRKRNVNAHARKPPIAAKTSSWPLFLTICAPRSTPSWAGRKCCGNPPPRPTIKCGRAVSR